MIDLILSMYIETDKEYIDNCKKCFLEESNEIQEFIQNANTDELEQELKRLNWTTTYKNYCRAIKYELMLRMDFEQII